MYLIRLIYNFINVLNMTYYYYTILYIYKHYKKLLGNQGGNVYRRDPPRSFRCLLLVICMLERVWSPRESDDPPSPSHFNPMIIDIICSMAAKS